MYRAMPSSSGNGFTVAQVENEPVRPGRMRTLIRIFTKLGSRSRVVRLCEAHESRWKAEAQHRCRAGAMIGLGHPVLENLPDWFHCTSCHDSIPCQGRLEMRRRLNAPTSNTGPGLGRDSALPHVPSLAK